MERIGEHWLLPVLAPVPLERLNGAHCAEVDGRGMNVCSPDVPPEHDHRSPVRRSAGTTRTAFAQVAEADGNRTRRRREAPPTGFEVLSGGLNWA